MRSTFEYFKAALVTGLLIVLPAWLALLLQLPLKPGVLANCHEASTTRRSSPQPPSS
jgi:hypothetical protein